MDSRPVLGCASLAYSVLIWSRSL